MKYLLAVFAVLSLWQIDCKTSLANAGTNNNEKIEKSASTENDSRRNTQMNDTNQTLCQLTIDLPELEQYFHPTAPNRKPLHVAKNAAVNGDLELRKFGEPVVFIGADEAKQKSIPVFEFTLIEVKGSSAVVSFRYAVEGIKGWINFSKVGNDWKVESREITES